MKKEIVLGLKIALVLVVMLLSFFVFSKKFAEPEFFETQIEYLDEKKSSVLELAGASTTASLAITALPGDMATPIAEKITDLSSYFLLIVGAIVLEKYLLTVASYAAFRVLIPVACLLLLIFFIGQNENYKKAGVKLTGFALAVSLLIPVSIRVSRMIEATYEAGTDHSVESILEVTEEMTADPETESAENWWQAVWQEAKEAVSRVSSSVSAAPKQLSELCNRFIEAVAVLIITSCVIPILVLLSFLWLIKLFLGLEIQPSAFRLKERPRQRSRENEEG